MQLEDALKMITPSFIAANFSNGKIPLVLRIFNDEDSGSFDLTPGNMEGGDYTVSFEGILVYLTKKLGYEWEPVEDFDEACEYFDNFFGNKSPKFIQFLYDLSEDFEPSHNDIDWQVMECSNSWKCHKLIDKKDIADIKNFYNSTSKYFEIVDIKSTSEDYENNDTEIM